MRGTIFAYKGRIVTSLLLTSNFSHEALSASALLAQRRAEATKSNITHLETLSFSRFAVQGRRQLDPGTGDEAGTTEGDFEVHWSGDFFYGKVSDSAA